MDKHTKTPWKSGMTQAGVERVLGAKCELVAQGLDQGDAQLIVRAVNCHEELLGLLTEMVERNDAEELDAEAVEMIVEEARRAIAKAESK